MAIEVGTHQEETGTLVVGTAVLTPVALNPSLEDLIAMGLREPTDKSEPQYLVTGKNSGEDWRIISIWLQGENNVFNPKTSKTEVVDLLVELKFLLSVAPGKLFINQENRFSGADKKATLGDTARPEHTGEHKVMDFIKALCRVGKGKKCYIENMAALIEHGDTSELGGFIEAGVKAGFAVRVALGVENSAYQRVHTESFAQDNASSLVYFYSQLAKQSGYVGDVFYGAINSDSSTLQVQNATKLRFYNEEEALVHQDAQQKRKQAAAAMVPNSPAGMAPGMGGATAPAAPAAPAAEQYQQPGRNFGGNPNLAPQAPTAPPANIAGDDDNDLPF